MLAALNTLFPPVISFAAAALTWVIANFLAEPLLAFYRRRRGIRASIVYAANVDKKNRPDVYDATCEELRRHAVELDALNETAPRPVLVWLRWRGFDLAGATSATFGFSNSLGTYDGSRENARNRIRKTLKFKGEF